MPWKDDPDDGHVAGRLLRGSVVVRVAAVTAVFLPLTWLAALLLVLPAPH
jgi:hypothetical protein